MNRGVIMVVLVAFGGAFGSAARYVLAGLVQRFVPPGFPYGTFTVNILGCLTAGALIARFESHGFDSPAARAFVFAGVLGGFTTFSALASETFALARGGAALAAAINSAGQLVAGLIALWAGYLVAAV